MKNLFFTAFVLTITNFLGIKTLAQKDISPYVVNPLIGDTLSQEERDYYQLFPKIDGFQCAVFYLNPDSTLNAAVKYYDDGIFKDTLIENYKSIKSLHYHIYARNALENGIPDTAFKFEAPVYSKGADVNVYMNNGLETSGELLSVRENSLLILKPECNENSKNPDCISKINTSEINKLIIKGNSNLGWGIGLGLLASVIAGAFIYSSNYDSNRWLASLSAYDKSKTPIILSSIGLITLGVTVGILTSTPDKTIEPFSEDDIVGLRAHSRFIEKEPDRLIKVK